VRRGSSSGSCSSGSSRNSSSGSSSGRRVLMSHTHTHVLFPHRSSWVRSVIVRSAYVVSNFKVHHSPPRTLHTPSCVHYTHTYIFLPSFLPHIYTQRECLVSSALGLTLLVITGGHHYYIHKGSAFVECAGFNATRNYGGADPPW